MCLVCAHLKAKTNPTHKNTMISDRTLSYTERNAEYFVKIKHYFVLHCINYGAYENGTCYLYHINYNAYDKGVLYPYCILIGRHRPLVLNISKCMVVLLHDDVLMLTAACCDVNYVNSQY